MNDIHTLLILYSKKMFITPDLVSVLATLVTGLLLALQKVLLHRDLKTQIHSPASFTPASF